MSAMQVVGAVLMVLGATFTATAALGVIVFPTALSRMHAATKSASLGLALLTLGGGVASGEWGLVGVGVLVTSFLFATSPISGHMLGRAAYLAGQAPGLVHDDLVGNDPQPLLVAERTRAGFSFGRWLALLIVWVLLWRALTPGVVLGGALVAAVIEYLRAMTPGLARVRPWGLLVFVVRYLGMVVASSVRVARQVLTPNNEDIREAIVAVPLSTDSISVALLVANAITYTPGTLTVELTEEPRILYVHVLHFASVDAVRDEVAGIERLVRGALASDR